MKKLFLLLVLILFPMTVFAGSATIGFSGSTSCYPGDKVTVNLVVEGVNGTIDNAGIKNINGSVNYDGSYLGDISYNPVYGGMMNQFANGKFIFSANPGSEAKSGTTIGKFTFTCKQLGTTTVSVGDIKASEKDNSTQAGVNRKSLTINIKNPPSGNNNLGSLSVNPGGISFNKGNTNYSVSVEANVTSVNISATAEDQKASVSGTGSKNLNYGSNKFTITVKAENGSTKNYVINVNRKDNRSSDATLKSLTVSNGKLNPGFDTKKTEYSMEVPFSVSKLNISAVATDAKSKVAINNNSLVAEKITRVEIKVTAENGSTRSYVINCKRGKDPNKILSKDNNLLNIGVSSGVLSPVFDTNRTNYIVYIPYEVSTMEFTYEVSDKEYASVQLKGPKNIAVGDNKFILAVKAEDESIKEYVVDVYRGINLEGELSKNTNLKLLQVDGGKLTTKFDKNVHVYFYKSKKGIKLETLPEDVDSKVNVINEVGVYAVLVTAPSGDMSGYILIPKATNVAFIVAIIMFSIVFVILGAYYIIKFIKYKKSRN